MPTIELIANIQKCEMEIKTLKEENAMLKLNLNMAEDLSRVLTKKVKRLEETNSNIVHDKNTDHDPKSMETCHL